MHTVPRHCALRNRVHVAAGGDAVQQEARHSAMVGQSVRTWLGRTPPRLTLAALLFNGTRNYPCTC